MRASGFVAIAVLASLSPLARAGEQSTVVDGVRITVGTHWPETLNRGWQPATVHVLNETDDDRDVDLTFSSGMGIGTDVVTKSVRVRGRGVEQFELALPARPNASNAYTLTIQAGERRFIGNVGATTPSPVHERIVLVASRAGPSTVATAGWAAALSLESDPRAPETQESQFSPGIGIVTPGAAALPATPEHVRVGGIAFELLSSLPEAYTSLHAVVLDVEGGTPTRAPLDAILASTRAGGVLAITGRGASEFVAKEPALARWAEERFLARTEEALPIYSMGLGSLLVLEGTDRLAQSDVVRVLNDSIEDLAPLDGRVRRDFGLPLPGTEVPFRALTLLLVLFAILVGPVNLILVRRSKRPALLLLTIPAIAILFSVGLVGYGILAQGLQIRATSMTVGVLDQRVHQGSSEERREVFAGLATGSGLEPGAGSVVLRDQGGAFDYRNRREYRADYGESLALSGAWLPVRTTTRFRVTTDRASRGRVEVQHDASGWKIVNGLDVTVTRLLLRDADGEIHAFEGPIVPGRTAPAAAIGPTADEIKEFQDHRVLATSVREGGFLPLGTWIARVESSPLVDPLGLDYEAAHGRHILLGVLDLAEVR